MRASSILLLASTFLFHSAFAMPPACLLGALNKDQQNLADIKTICSKNAADVQGSISNMCGGMTDEAMSYFSSVCKQVANVSVSSAAASSTGGSAASATGTHSSTDVLSNPTPTANGDAAASNTASGSTQSTGAAATNAAGPFAAVALAAAGLVIVV